MKKSILLIIIGILILAVDIQIPIGKAYPEMLEARDLGLEFQGKIINNFIGTRPSVDIISDIIGYALIFIGSIFLTKKSKKFIFAMLLIPVAIYLNIVLPQFAYHFELRELYLKVAGNSFLVVFLEMGIEYFVIHGIVSITDNMQNKWHNNELLAAWILAMMSKGLLVGIDFFFGQKIIYYLYSLVMIAATIFYISRLFVTVNFKPEESK
ncbi:MAG TPA: hypothetical protein VJ888_06745 [Mobilitalea sp.]|nr:hypothetical protein [Mobilitalea sp.]